VAQVVNALKNALKNGLNAASAALANIKSAIVQKAPLQAGLAINLQEKNEPTDNNLTEEDSLPVGAGEERGADLAEIQEEFDDIAERADVLSRQAAEMAGTKPEKTEPQKNDIAPLLLPLLTGSEMPKSEESSKVSFLIMRTFPNFSAKKSRPSEKLTTLVGETNPDTTCDNSKPGET